MKKAVCNATILITAIFLLIACNKEESPNDPKLTNWPLVKTYGITNAMDTTVTLNGTVNANGLSTKVIFEYGTTTKYGNTVIASQSPVTGNGFKDVSADISGLKPDSTYHFRVKAENNQWIKFYGEDAEFTVQTLKVSDLKVSNITKNSATLNATVNAGGLPTTVTFEYGTTTNYGNSITANQNTLTGNSFTNVSADISGLNACETFHYRVKAVNSLRIRYSQDKIFILTTLPTLTTDLTFITSTTALSGGSISDDGCSVITDRGVMLGKRGIRPPRPTGKVPSLVYWFTRTHDGTGTGNFTSNLTELTPSTTYYVKSYAITPNGTFYGKVISFTTPP